MWITLGEKWQLLVRSRGRGPYSGPLRSRSGNPVYWHEGGGEASLRLSGELQVPAGGDAGCAAGDHEGEPRHHWHRTLWLDTAMSLAVVLVCCFDLHGWSMSDMNVHVRTCDGLLAPYTYCHGSLFTSGYE
jgi:hypothetical protein